MGISSSIVDQYVDDSVVSIEDYSPLVCRIREALDHRDLVAAARLLPPQREYVLASPEVAARLGISPT